jgi:hypothetical protein
MVVMGEFLGWYGIGIETLSKVGYVRDSHVALTLLPDLAVAARYLIFA